MRCTIALVLSGLLIVTFAACGGESEADREAKKARAEADSVAMAEAQYNASVFDTVTWEAPEARLERGGLVYRSSCLKCHGKNGGGNGDLAIQFQLEVPPFQDPALAQLANQDSLRRRIFVGHEGAMPNWGLHGLKYRDVDAAAAYVMNLMSPGGTSQGR